MRSNHLFQALPLPAADAVAAGWPWAADWLQQMMVAGESASILLRGLEAMRKIQQQAAQQASSRRVAAVGKLSGRPPADVLALHAELLREDVEGAARCWQQLTGAALELNAELLGCATHLVSTEDAFAQATRLLHA